MIKYSDQKQLREERVYLKLHFHSPVHHPGRLGQELEQGRDLKAEADAKARQSTDDKPKSHFPHAQQVS